MYDIDINKYSQLFECRKNQKTNQLIEIKE